MVKKNFVLSNVPSIFGIIAWKPTSFKSFMALWSACKIFLMLENVMDVGHEKSFCHYNWFWALISTLCFFLFVFCIVSYFETSNIHGVASTRKEAIRRPHSFVEPLQIVTWWKKKCNLFALLKNSIFSQEYYFTKI